MFTINRNSKLPLYQQIYELLRNDISSGKLKPGDIVPPTSELTSMYEVSSITVRQALELLENEGKIFRQRGKGTFVAHPSLAQNSTRIISFTEDMIQRGCKPVTTLLASDLVEAPAEIAEKLEVIPGEKLAYVKRLRLADGEPLSIEESFLINRFCDGILEHDFTSKSMRLTLEKEFGVRLVRAKQTIRAIPAPSDLIKLLSIKSNTPLLHIERISISQYEVPIEFLRIYYRGDRYTLYNELQG